MPEDKSEQVGAPEPVQPPRPGDFREIGVSGLDWTMGMVRADPKQELQGPKGAEQFNLMRREDPTVAAVLLALSLPLRQASWRVNPASTSGADVEAAEFIESALYDMSSSWDDTLTEIATMFPFGWAWMEWVLKRRLGAQPDSGLSSQYDDGRIAFRKMALRAQTSLDSWGIDENGGVQAMIQVNPATQRTKPIPIGKSLLFRTTKECNNPEGMSVLRPGYRPWKYKVNMERMEAIGLQRALTGVPNVKFTGGYTTLAQAGTQSDEHRAQALIKGLYQNTVLGVITDDHMDVTFLVPDMQGITGDSTTVIQRYDEGIARSTLAMYILLGTRERGSYALSKELGDLFFLAVEGFIGSVAEVLTRWAVPVLMRHNVFPGISQYPTISTAISRRVDLTALAEFINKTVGAMVITPDAELEAHIRELADFPPQAISLTPEGKEITPEKGPSGERPITPQEGEPPGTAGKPTPGSLTSAPRPPAPEPTNVGHARLPAEVFAARATSPLATYKTQTDEVYKSVLTGTYDSWIDLVDSELRDIPPGSDRSFLQEKWKELLIALLLLLKQQGWEWLPQAVALGYGSPALPPELRAQVEAELVANDQYLETSLLPRIAEQIDQDLLYEIMLLYWGGKVTQAQDLLRTSLASRRGHLASYAGMFWRAIWIGALFKATEQELKGKARWVLDPIARHCDTCLRFGDRTYKDLTALVAATAGILPGTGTECDGWCRCHLEVYQRGAWRVI